MIPVHYPNHHKISLGEKIKIQALLDWPRCASSQQPCSMKLCKNKNWLLLWRMSREKEERGIKPFFLWKHLKCSNWEGKASSSHKITLLLLVFSNQRIGGLSRLLHFLLPSLTPLWPPEDWHGLHGLSALPGSVAIPCHRCPPRRAAPLIWWPLCWWIPAGPKLSAPRLSGFSS